MSKSSNTTRSSVPEGGEPAAPLASAARPLTARSVVASLLLGVDPPRLPGRHLVRVGGLFGLGQGAVRVALSRMTAAGELRAADGVYELDGHLLERHARQRQSPAATHGWDGSWVVAVVPSGRRAADERSDLRQAAAALRLAELREGVWLRPDNLDRARLPESRVVVDAQCESFVARPDDPARLVGELWDLDGWADEARRLRAQLDAYASRLEAGETELLADAFVLAAEGVRHQVLDPLLPTELLPADWPGAAFRETSRRHESAFAQLLRDTLREGTE